MKSLQTRIIPMTAVVLVTLLLGTLAFGAGDRNSLWHVVSNCIDTGRADYCGQCRFPRSDTPCPNGDCIMTTEVWAESGDFVVIRDRKMCGCPEGFVHGLAMPRSRVSGVEDPARPDGIWRFAWEAAARRLPEHEIALVVNPKRLRSQDQLHVHIVRLGQIRLPTDPRSTVLVDSLDKVWRAAAAKAAGLGRQDYGVLVSRNGRSGRFLIVVDDGSPEKKFTVWSCR